MTCKWNYDDCINKGEQCLYCRTEGFKYKPKKIIKTLKVNKNKADKRMGSRFEFENHKKKEKLVSSDMTLNSGATAKEKGDEQISGIINIMEELKTKVAEQIPGKQTFTIQKKWLQKLNREAKAENKEFWYLKFCFHENETDEVYCIVESDVLMSMVKTMITDRTKAKQCDSTVDMHQKQYLAEQAKAIALQAQIDFLEAKIKILEGGSECN